MPRAVALFDATPEECALLEDASGVPVRVALPPRREDVQEAEVAIVQSFADLPEGVFGWMPRLRYILSLPAGAEHIPFDRLPPNVRVASTHGPNADALAEHAFALLLAAAKRIPQDQRALREGAFDQETPRRRLRGATLLVLGVGPIGAEVLRLGHAFGLRTLAFRPSGNRHPHADEVVDRAGLPEAWGRADFLVLALPLKKETRRIVDADALARMKPDAVLVNVARGKLVDRDALASHLETHPSFTYATDVWWRYPRGNAPFDEPMLSRDNVLGTPHAGAMVEGWRKEMVAAAAENLRRVAAGDPPEGLEDPSDYR